MLLFVHIVHERWEHWSFVLHLFFYSILVLTELAKSLNSGAVALGINHSRFINRFTCRSQCHVQLWETEKQKQCFKCLSNGKLITLDPCTHTPGRHLFTNEQLKAKKKNRNKTKLNSRWEIWKSLIKIDHQCAWDNCWLYVAKVN